MFGGYGHGIIETIAMAWEIFDIIDWYLWLDHWFDIIYYWYSAERNVIVNNFLFD